MLAVHQPQHASLLQCHIKFHFNWLFVAGCFVENEGVPVEWPWESFVLVNPFMLEFISRTPYSVQMTFFPNQPIHFR